MSKKVNVELGDSSQAGPQGQRPQITQQQFQQMVYVYQLLESQQQMIMEQLDMIDQQIAGVSVSKQTLEGLQEVEAGHEIIIPLGSNAFTKATLIDPKKVTVFVKKDILIEKSLDDGLASISRMLESNKNIRERLMEQLRDISQKLGEIKPQIDAIYQGMGRR